MDKIFIYSNNAEKKKQIKKVAESLRIQMQELSVNDLSRTVGAIAGVSKEKKTDVIVPLFFNMPEVLIFSGLNENKLDLFLQAYRMAKIEPIGLKAVITMYNCSWTLFQLIEELKRERSSLNN